VERGATGNVVSVGPPRNGAELLSVIRLELSGPGTKQEGDQLTEEAVSVLKEARLAVQDFQPMLDKLKEVEASLSQRVERSLEPPSREDVKEAIAFLEWIGRANFVFLGYRGYDIRGTGEDMVIQVEPGSGLGILRDEARSSFARPKPLSSLPEDLQERILAPRLVLVHKTNTESHVLRRTRMDYIGIKKLNDRGLVIGEQRFLGLFTARAYNDLPSDIPILRRKLDEILKKANVIIGSHDHKEIFSIFTSIPKHELFVTETDQIADAIFTIMSASSRREVRVSYRPDLLERGVSVMVLLPKEKFNSEVRTAIQDLLADEFKGTFVDYRLALSDEPLARLHFYFSTPTGTSPKPPLPSLEAKITELTRTWDERLKDALLREHGAEEGLTLSKRYEKAFPAAYLAQKGPETAVSDIRHIEDVLREGKLQVAIALGKIHPHGKASILKIYRPGEPFVLSSLMPMLTHLGLQVLDEQTFRVTPKTKRNGGEAQVFFHSFRVHGPDGSPLASGRMTKNLEETIPLILEGEAENDSLNALMTLALLHHRQVAVLRAYDAYLLQLGGPWTQRTTYATLCDHPGSAALLLELFESRFDPSLTPENRARREEKARAEFQRSLESVSGITEDQILRAFENLIGASIRTNYFGLDSAKKRPVALAVKIRCQDVQAMPDPRPLYEIFVHGPRVEGVHLRSGKVARGGIRWSDRKDDYRMEILGLMKAQRTKNAVIVPVGAKGGFILRQLPTRSPRGDAPAVPGEEIRRQYEVFIGCLLDLTDNIVGGKVVHPEGIVVHDDDDPYLVVAADRGTATFSDVANQIAVSRSFWLGDAFASGGSRGYDHKKEGITARGAWKCVERHFRELGIDVDKQTFTASGIGDMSGDVFGNGLLHNGNVLLLAAFNHLHIFLDPKPDPKVSLEERRRLFHLPGSSWSDYDPQKISAGGGVHRRDAKSVALSAEAREMLGIASTAVNGDDLVRAILKMPVDLLCNGGIGTYVKARSESNRDVGDPANNAVRVDGAEVKARVIAEGGNLGFTQLGRIEYARAGGRINTDFIDNSAGVDLSDHEVNLKILLSTAVTKGSLKEEERDEVLLGVKAEVCEQVLLDNYLQSAILSVEERRGVAALDEHRFLIDELSSEGLLNREVERIPSDQDLVRLRGARLGLTRPSLAVLLAYAKIDASMKVLSSPLPDEPDLESFLVGYFPSQIASRFSGEIKEHRLRREIAATSAVNAAINYMGITLFHRLSRETGQRFEGILRSFLIVHGLAEGTEFHAGMDRLYEEKLSDIEAHYRVLSRFADAVAEVMISVLRKGLDRRPAQEAIPSCRAKVSEVNAALLPEMEPFLSASRTVLPGITEPVLRRLWLAERLPEALDIASLREEGKISPAAAVQIWREAGSFLFIDRLEKEAARIEQITAEDIQTCRSLREAAREHQRRLARAMLKRSIAAGTKQEEKEACAVHRILPPEHRERVRSRRILEGASTRGPLTLSGLFVVVEALGRLVAEV
jgi:glutamate dehydrogenase